MSNKRERKLHRRDIMRRMETLRDGQCHCLLADMPMPDDDAIIRPVVVVDDRIIEFGRVRCSRCGGERAYPMISLAAPIAMGAQA